MSSVVKGVERSSRFITRREKGLGCRSCPQILRTMVFVRMGVYTVRNCLANFAVCD